MGKEIERKFLINENLLPKNIHGEKYIQTYIAITEQGTVRNRTKNEIAILTIKTSEKGMTRNEFEYEIPIKDAKILIELFNDNIIFKTRYKITIDKKVWEIDQFHELNEGLWLAEIELESENELFDLPKWIKKEVTGNKKYFNAYLSKNPFKFWYDE